MLVLKFIKISLLSLILVCTSAYSSTSIYDLPNLGTSAPSVLTQVQMRKLGTEFMRMVRHFLPIEHDAIANDYINHLGYQLVAHCPNNSHHFHFFIVKDSGINAFAGPDGNIGVNSGLILMADNESELAAIMAHEIAHVTQQHILRTIAKAKNMSIAGLATIAAAIAVGAYNPAAATGLATAGIAGNLQYYLNFSREFEKEADECS